MQEETPVVLVVERDAERADLYATWLRVEWTVRVAHDARAALAVADEVDAVVFGRDRPDGTGAIVDAIRERDATVPTVAVTADDAPTVPELEPDERLAEPPSAETLRGAVSKHLARRTYARGVEELFAAASERAAVESGRSERSPEERRRELEERIEELRDRADAALDSVVAESGFTTAYRVVEDTDDPGD